jgi:hypothetical protein
MIPKWHEGSNFSKIFGQRSCPQFHLSLLGFPMSLLTWRHMATKVGTPKNWGQQWQLTSKNLPEPLRSHEWPIVSAKPA